MEDFDGSKNKVVVIGCGVSGLDFSLRKALIASLPQHKIVVCDDHIPDQIQEFLIKANEMPEVKDLRVLKEVDLRGGSRKKGGRYKWPRR